MDTTKTKTKTTMKKTYIKTTLTISKTNVV